MRANSPYLPHLVFSILILSLLLHSPFKRPTLMPSPSPSPEYSMGIDDFDKNLDNIVNDKSTRWIYADKDKKCLLASYILENGDEDFLEGWWKKSNDIYRFEPINPGEGPLWFIKKIFSVRFETKNLCRVGMEIDLQQNQGKSSHYWYVLDFKDSYVSGEMFKTKPSSWDSMVEGNKLK